MIGAKVSWHNDGGWLSSWQVTMGQTWLEVAFSMKGRTKLLARNKAMSCVITIALMPDQHSFLLRVIFPARTHGFTPIYPIQFPKTLAIHICELLKTTPAYFVVVVVKAVDIYNIPLRWTHVVVKAVGMYVLYCDEPTFRSVVSCRPRYQGERRLRSF